MEYLALKQIIIDQKAELQNIYKKEKIIKREILDEYRNYIQSDQIKVITGPRRAGKSILCYQLLEDKDFAYINFDDENLAGLKKENLNLVLKAFYEIYGKPKFIFLDEVQNIDGWELFVNRLKRSGFNIIVTGSNAKLLSKELATHLTGRHFSLELFPFSFREFLNYYEVQHDKIYFTTEETAIMKRELEKYIVTGGFPECFKEPSPKRYLSSLYSSILTKDILLRHRVKYIKVLKEFSNYLISNFSCQMTSNKLKNIFELKSVHTAQNYFSFLEESYLIFLIEKFSFKFKEKVISPRKVYAIDTGLIHTFPTRSSKDIGRLYENIVAIELMRKRAILPDFEVYYWQDYSGKEVDFILKRGLKVSQMIQVCFDLDNYDTRMRQYKSLVKASKELNCSDLLVITSEKKSEEAYKDKTIKVVPLWEWLLK